MRNTCTGASAAPVLVTATANARAQIARAPLWSVSASRRCVRSPVAPNASISYAIVGIDGFLDVRRQDATIPVGLFNVSGDRPELRGATRVAIKAMPAFDCTR